MPDLQDEGVQKATSLMQGAFKRKLAAKRATAAAAATATDKSGGDGCKAVEEEENMPDLQDEGVQKATSFMQGAFKRKLAAKRAAAAAATEKADVAGGSDGDVSKAVENQEDDDNDAQMRALAFMSKNKGGDAAAIDAVKASAATTTTASSSSPSSSSSSLSSPSPMSSSTSADALHHLLHESLPLDPTLESADRDIIRGRMEPRYECNAVSCFLFCYCIVVVAGYSYLVRRWKAPIAT
jgi:hypothetical protein